MDDTQNNSMQQGQSGSQGVTPMDSTSAAQVTSMGDLAGMTPPPAPMQWNNMANASDSSGMNGAVPQQDPSMSMQMPQPAPVAPDWTQNAQEPVPSYTQASPMQEDTTQSYGMSASSPTSPVQADSVTMSQPMPNPGSMPANVPANGMEDDYAYAEDLLDEILDSLDRIEAKLEAIEKKVGQ